MSIIYDLVEAKLIIENSVLNDAEKETMMAFFGRVERMVQDLEEMEQDLDDIPDPPNVSPISSPGPSSPSPLPSLSSISSLITLPDLHEDRIRSLERSHQELVKSIDTNSRNIQQNGQDLIEILNVLQGITRRQRAQHLRVCEFISDVNRSLSTQIESEAEELKTSISTFDRANNFFIKELNRLAGHSNE